MSDALIGRHTVRFTLDGPSGAPVLAFVNGLTQYSNLWDAYSRHFAARGLRVLRFDMLGQGESDKPALRGRFEDHWRTLEGILDHIGEERAFVAGISFGGTVAVQFACERPERCAGLIAMSCFAEMPPQLFLMGCGLYEALVQIGLPALQRWLMPMNMSDEWLVANKDAMPEMMRRGYAINDLYALQNLMEAVNEFEPITDRLPRVACPTLILNGEYDFFTPRKCHEVLRKGIKRSRLVIVQHAYHAYTLEHPAVTMRLIGVFLDHARAGTWPGDQSVWIAADDPSAPEPWFPCAGDHLRAVPMAAPAKTDVPAQPTGRSRRAARSKKTANAS
jgi:3-oxoadipate enol-lactonase